MKGSITWYLWPIFLVLGILLTLYESRSRQVPVQSAKPQFLPDADDQDDLMFCRSDAQTKYEIGQAYEEDEKQLKKQLKKDLKACQNIKHD